MSIREPNKPVIRDWRAEYLDRLNQARRAAEILTECYPEGQWPVVSGQWPEQKGFADHRPLTTEH